MNDDRVNSYLRKAKVNDQYILGHRGSSINAKIDLNQRWPTNFYIGEAYTVIHSENGTGHTVRSIFTVSVAFFTNKE